MVSVFFFNKYSTKAFFFFFSDLLKKKISTNNHRDGERRAVNITTGMANSFVKIARIFWGKIKIGKKKKNKLPQICATKLSFHRCRMLKRNLKWKVKKTLKES